MFKSKIMIMNTSYLLLEQIHSFLFNNKMANHLSTFLEFVSFVALYSTSSSDNLSTVLNNFQVAIIQAASSAIMDEEGGRLSDGIKYDHSVSDSRVS